MAVEWGAGGRNLGATLGCQPWFRWTEPLGLHCLWILTRHDVRSFDARGRLDRLWPRIPFLAFCTLLDLGDIAGHRNWNQHRSQWRTRRCSDHRWHLLLGAVAGTA